MKHMNNKVTYRYEKLTFLSAVMAGLFAHGYVFLHNIQIHDNVYNFYLGGTLELGRWMLFLCNTIMNKINGNYYHYQAPWYLGVCSLIFTALAAGFVCNLLRFKNKISCVATGAIMVSFPAMTSMYAYMFTSALYSLGLLLTVIGVWLICTKKKWYMWLLGVCAAGCGVGMYQMYISVFLSLFLMYYFVEIYDEKEKKSAKTISLRAFFYIGATGAIMIFYYVILKLCLWHYNTELSNYRGISEGSNGITAYLYGVAKAYRYFFVPTSTGTDNMFQNNLLYIYWVVLALSLAGGIFVVVRKFMKNKFAAAVIAISSCFLPLAFNFIYVMVSEEQYSLMMYGEVMFFVWIVVLSEYIEFELRDMTKIYAKRIMIFSMPALVLFFAFMYARTSNICYLKADEMQTAATSYFNRLVEKVETIPGYTEDTPVYFVNYTHRADDTVFRFSEYNNETWIYPYNIESFTNDYNWLNFMITSTGWQPTEADDSLTFALPASTIDAMPNYPADGSVAMIDGIVVVKFEAAE